MRYLKHYFVEAETLLADPASILDKRLLSVEAALDPSAVLRLSSSCPLGVYPL